MTVRLSIVTLGVTDLARSRTFYEGLGFERSAHSQDTITFYRMAGSILGLYGRQELAEDAGVPEAGEGFRGVTLAMNLDSPAEVDALWDQWVAAGAAPIKRPEQAFWGGYSSYVADPDGHLWELAHNPFMPVGEDGVSRLSK